METINAVDRLNLYSIDINSVTATLIGQIPYLGVPFNINGMAILNVFVPPVPCLHPDTLVLTSEKQVKIKELKANDKVINMHNKEVQIVNSIRFNASDTFYNIKANSLGNNQPSEDLLIRNGHPLIYKNKRITPEKLYKKLGPHRICPVKLDKAISVWNLASNKQEYVMMNNVPVATWCDADLRSQKKFGYTRF